MFINRLVSCDVVWKVAQLLVLGLTTASAALPPIVDLGYAIHQASFSVSNQTNVYYNFSNIRYAAPPLGGLRFSAPEPPLNNRSAGIQDGLYGNICPQAFATWQIGAVSLNAGASNENEDCLFLDVIVPKVVFDKKSARGPVPVFVWLHGGGFTLGSKYAAGNPTGLLDQSLETPAKGQIWVGLNYRLGALGWLGGRTFAESGTPNAGLHDQQMAFEWVKDNIHLFGGDPTQVTVIGESAGGGSILHHITAYGGRKAPFQQAVLQSPAFIPRPLNSQSETTFQQFLSAANVSSLAEARNLDTNVIQHANKLSQALAFHGTFSFGPTPDGSFVPDLPGKLLLERKYDSSLRILTAHNTNESGRYTPPTTSTSEDFITYMRLYFPYISADALTHLTQILYPPVYDGSQSYTTPFMRLNLALSDFTFTCTTNWLGHAYANRTHNYIFSVPPGNHTQDVPYTFYNGPNTMVRNDTLAVMMQRYLTGFAKSGSPNRQGLPHWVEYGTRSRVYNFNETFTDIRVDVATANARCDWWQKAFYVSDL